MLIIKTSTLTGIRHTREIAITESELNAWRAGDLIQNVLPNLSPDDREFLISGITPEEWKEYFSDPLD